MKTAPKLVEPLPVYELFYSYAHTDSRLRDRLEKHLSALKHAGLIHSWSDRRIEPGSEWTMEIQAAMERAGIILLLVSADFLASTYCYEHELPFALSRHESGYATVVPILLRPVLWQELPIAKLQFLPIDGRPVTSWPNYDEAFAEIATSIWQLIYNKRLVTLARPPVNIASSTLENRTLDAAISSTVVLNEPTDLVVMIRSTESGGLRSILRLDGSYSATEEDVRSTAFELEFPKDPEGRALPAAVELLVESPQFKPSKQRKAFYVPPIGDSPVCVFLMVAAKRGPLVVNINIVNGNSLIGSRTLRTEGVTRSPSGATYRCVSVPLVQKEAADSPAASSDHPVAESGPLSRMADQASRSPGLPRPLARKLTIRRTVPIIGALVFVCGAGLIATRALKYPAPASMATSSFVDHLARGRAIMAKGDWADARKEFSKAEAIAGNEKESAVAAYRIAQTYREEGNVYAALDWYRQCLKYFPSRQAADEMMRLDLQRADKQIPAGDIVAGLTRPMADRSPVADEDSIDLTILFDSGEATLKPAAEEQIHQLALALTSDELKGKTFLITGHADSTGDTEANMKLSLRRACTVRDALLADKAILPKQLICVGKGQTETRYPEHTPDANRLNRRVQIALLPENSPHKPTGSLVQPPPSPTKLNRDSTAKEPFRGPTVYAH